MLRAQSGKSPGVVAALEGLVADGVLRADPAQRAAAEALDEVRLGLEALENGGGLAALFRRRHKVPKGLYVWGDVGRGKTLLMDLFFADIAVEARRRVHFHEFMDEVHAAIAAFRASADAGSGARDPIPAVVKPIIRDCRLLCFDEFHVSDITDAMLLKRLFERLFSAGVVVVATSNVEPDRLYENGLNRQLFMPFVELLKKHCRVIELKAAADYRELKFAGRDVFFFGDAEQARAGLDRLFAELTGNAQPEPATVVSLGRQIRVPRASGRVARFAFADLCETPLGARDYLRLARAFDAILIDGIPQFDRTRPSAAKRFILLVDTLYDQGVKLGASFAVPLAELGENRDTAFEFQRCRSRLTEMQSETYLGAARRPLSNT